ncbi:hypothetical protein [Winogradskyella wichelsiae]|uniref:hypothetical protein n=1 Tax=Winogradskyella wichelsiae TaxID=2697007 RepID=UPI0015CE73E5|nr:hypothetical protein [Winogradskyella wichelsiae]
MGIKITLSLLIISFTGVINYNSDQKSEMLNNYLVDAGEQKIWIGNLTTKNLEEFASGMYTEIDGSIMIENYDGLNLILLKTLQKCAGNIEIGNNENLESLKGLENLQIVGGRFSILNNPELYNYCTLQKILINKGIKGVEISKDIIEKWEIEDNGYNPSLMNLQNKNCSIPKLPDFCFSC